MKAQHKKILLIGGLATAALLLATTGRADNTPVVAVKPSGTTVESDDRTIRNINRLHPKIRANAFRFVADARRQGINLIVTSSLRTIEEQNELYKQGRSKPGGIVTNAKGGTSYHNYGLAIDVVEIRDGKAIWNGDWDKIAKIGKANGFEWGGDFKSFVDRPHFQLRKDPANKNAKPLHHTELLKRYQAGRKDGNGYVELN